VTVVLALFALLGWIMCALALAGWRRQQQHTRDALRAARAANRTTDAALAQLRRTSGPQLRLVIDEHFPPPLAARIRTPKEIA
jgi:hypothetical protein